VMNEKPIQTARRLFEREERNRCLLCGREKQIEQHHVAGRRHDPEFTTPLCQACHALATENLRRADVNMQHEPNHVDRVRNALKAIAVFLRMLAETLWRLGDSLNRSRKKH